MQRWSLFFHFYIFQLFLFHLFFYPSSAAASTTSQYAVLLLTFGSFIIHRNSCHNNSSTRHHRKQSHIVATALQFLNNGQKIKTNTQLYAAEVMLRHEIVPFSRNGCSPRVTAAAAVADEKHNYFCVYFARATDGVCNAASLYPNSCS